MTAIYTSTIIDAPIEQVWPYLRNFGLLKMYHSAVAELSLEGDSAGDQIGSVRNVLLRDGNSVQERLIAMSDVDHSVSYAVQAADPKESPFENCIGSFRLRPITDRNATFIEWDTTFDVLVPGAGPAFSDFLVNQVYASCFRGLKALVANNNKQAITGVPYEMKLGTGSC